MLAAEINTRKKQSQRQKVKDARLKQLIKGQATPNSDLTTKSDRQATPNSELTAESAQLPTQAKTQPNEEVPTISKVKHSNKEHTSKMKTVPPVPPQATVKKAVAESSPAVNLNSLVVPGMNKQEQQSEFVQVGESDTINQQSLMMAKYISLKHEASRLSNEISQLAQPEQKHDASQNLHQINEVLAAVKH